MTDVEDTDASDAGRAVRRPVNRGPALTTVVRSGGLHQEQMIILGNGKDIDEMQASGEWIGATELREVRR